MGRRRSSTSTPSATPTTVSSSIARSFSKVTDSKAVERYLEDVDGEEDPEEEEEEDGRNVLFRPSAHARDRLAGLARAETADEVFGALEDQEDGEWSKEEVAQALATLFHIYKRGGGGGGVRGGGGGQEEFAQVLHRDGNYRRLVMKMTFFFIFFI